MASVARTAIGNFSHFESLQSGLETFFQSAEKGKAKFEELRKLSNETTFGVDELTDSFTQLANVGVPVDDINNQLTMLGNIAGGSKEKFADLVSIFAKINSTGKAGSMQLQQLATRGVPIYTMLKEIGVTGQATAKDVTEAFQKMTSEGGQFAGAMENINKTIEGKEGFISDYFKELTVNFAELSGIADGYKAVLDILKDAIGDVSDKLLEWNENLVMKALFQGTLITGVTVLATVIGVALVGAIKKVNAELKKTVVLKSILDPKTLVLALGAGIITGATIELGKYIKKQKELNDVLKDNAEASHNAFYTRNRPTSDKEVYNRSSSELTQLNELKAKQEAKFADIKTQLENLKKEDFSTVGLDVYDELKAELEKDLAQVSGSIERVNAFINVKQGAISVFENAEKIAESYRTLYTEMDEFFQSTSLGKANVTLDELETKLKDIEKLKTLEGKTYFDDKGNAVTLKFDNKQKKEIDNTVNYLQKEVNKVRIKIAVDGQTDWQMDLQKAWGFTDEDVFKGATKSTVYALQYAEEKQASYNQKVEEFNRILNDFKADESGLIESQIEKLTNAYQVLKNTTSYEGNEDSFKEYENKLKQLKAQLKDANGKDMIANIKKQNTEYQKILSSSKNWKDIEAQILDLEKNINIEDAKKYLELEKENQKYQQQLDIVQQIAEASKNRDIMSLLSAKTQEAYQNGNYGQAGALSFASSAVSASKDASNFVQGFQQGGVVGGVINALVGAFMEVAQSCEDFEKAMNPISNAMKQLKPTIELLLKGGTKIAEGFEVIFAAVQTILDALSPLIELLNDMLDYLQFPLLVIASLVKLIASLLKPLAQAIAIVLRVLTFGTLDLIQSVNDAMYENLVVQEEKTKKEKDLTNEYNRLLSAMEKQEEWYLKEKTAINAQTRNLNTTKVNDMIITPQGQFSTAPDDFIIASKHPEELGKGSEITFNMKVENTVSDQVEVKATAVNNSEGGKDIFIQISKKIAQDVALGANGWDGALSARDTRLGGRRSYL